MAEPHQDLPGQPAVSANFPVPTKETNLPPSSNVHVVEPGHLAADAVRGHKKRRGLIIVLVLLGVVLLAAFAFLGLRYYKVVYSAPKVFSTDCFELSLPGSYKTSTDASSSATSEGSSCHIELAVAGKGGVIAIQMKKQYEPNQMNQVETTAKKFVAGDSAKKRLKSQSDSTLDGIGAERLEYESDDENKKMIEIHYVGWRDKHLFMVGWLYNSANPVAKTDIEKSIASFRWK